VIYDLIKTLRM